MVISHYSNYYHGYCSICLIKRLFQVGLIGDIVPFANPTNITDAVGVFSYGNSVTDGIFIPSILLVIFVVLFISMKNWSTEIAMSSSTFIIMILAVLFRAVDLVPDW